MSTRSQWVGVGVFVVAVTGLVGLKAAIDVDLRPLGPGMAAPDFVAVDVETRNNVGLAAYDGEVILLNIWATWCRPCEIEMPSLQRLHDQLEPLGFRVVAVSIDEGSSDKVRDWVRERGLTFDVLHDRTRRIERAYQTTGVPESFIIDRTGTIVKRQVGAYEWDHPNAVALVRRYLDPGRSP